jgi:hypothetical protein
MEKMCKRSYNNKTKTQHETSEFRILRVAGTNLSPENGYPEVCRRLPQSCRVNTTIVNYATTASFHIFNSLFTNIIFAKFTFFFGLCPSPVSKKKFRKLDVSVIGY